MDKPTNEKSDQLAARETAAEGEVPAEATLAKEGVGAWEPAGESTAKETTAKGIVAGEGEAMLRDIPQTSATGIEKTANLGVAEGTTAAEEEWHDAAEREEKETE